MKTEWQFHFKTRGFYFECKHRFNARLNIQSAPPGESAVGERLCQIVISPDQDRPAADSSQVGRLLLTADGSPEATQTFAYWLAEYLSECISFHYGRMRILYGLVSAKRLPETPKEEESVGEGVYNATLQLEEPSSPRAFESSTFTSLPFRFGDERVLRQFNQACEAATSVDRYLGLFKALELIYCGHRRGKNPLPGLRASQELFAIAKEKVVARDSAPSHPLTRGEYDRLLKSMVRVRGNCSHLRERSGYAPGDPKLVSEVEPLAGIVQSLVSEAIRRRMFNAVAGSTTS